MRLKRFVQSLVANGSMSFNVIAYDAGTEANSEAPGTIPGPAVPNGLDERGFDLARDDFADQVTAHVGVITASNGLDTSTLNQSHRWDNPVARIVITRGE